MSFEFVAFPKIARLKRTCVITEKIDGTNAQIWIDDDGNFMVGSRSRWINPKDDNFGFARWAQENEDELRKLGPGHHYGEWWGSGIQRGYGLEKGEKRLSLFNAERWRDPVMLPACCSVVPVLYRGEFSTGAIDDTLATLASGGSMASPGFMKPEGIIVWHTTARQMFKVTLEKDEEPKGRAS